MNNAHAQISTWETSASITPKSSTDFSSTNFKTSLANLKNMGVNTVSFVIYYYTPNIYSTEIRRGTITPTDQSLIDAINEAHRIGLKVTLKPHLDSLDGRWRANIDPPDRQTWFTNYGNMIKHYATIGQQRGVEQIVIGTELIRMSSAAHNPTNTQNWNNLISQVKAIYTGKLTYSAQWSGFGAGDSLDEKYQIGFWDSMDTMGLSAYFSIAPEIKSPTTQQIADAWAVIDSNTIGPWQQTFNKPVVLTEVGYRSVVDANEDPWSYWREGAVDQGLQARLYQGMIDYWDAVSYMDGFHLWEWESNPNAGGSNSTSFTPQNKQAEQVIKEALASAPAPPPPPPPSPDPPTGTSYVITGSVTPASPAVNQEVSARVNVRPSNALTNVIVDIEIYNSSGAKVYQRYFAGENLSANTEKAYNVAWTPTASGNYVIKAGIFRYDWSRLFYWNNGVHSFMVTAQAPPPTTAYNLTGSSNPAQPSVRQSTEVTVGIRATASINDVIVNIEIYDSGGRRVHQRFFTGQNLTANTLKELRTTWAPSAEGEYRVKAGIFSNNWSTLHHWNDDLLRIRAGSVTNAAIEIWWPRNGEKLSGEQPFKALVKDMSLNEYAMYWQVDGGSLHEMSNQTSPSPHKLDLVNVGAWGDKGGQSFKVNFVAKDTGGRTIAERSVDIYVYAGGN